MKTVTFILSLMALVSASTIASADWDRGPGHGGPGWGGPGRPGHGPGWGPGHGGPGWGGPGRPGHGPGWGPGHGGPGWGPPPPPPPVQQYVSCASYGYAPQSCPVYGYIRGVQLVRQESASACILGQTWGYNPNSIWVTNGCRATFLVYLN